MNVDSRQWLLLAVSLGVPGVLRLARRDRALIAWICGTLCFSLFDTTIATNLPAGRAAGLILIPSSFGAARRLRDSRPLRAAVAQFLYLGVLAIIFGFVNPWPAGDFARTFNLTAPGRAIVYMTRLAVDLSLLVFVADWVRKSQRPDLVLRYTAIGASIAAAFGGLEFITRFDLYHFLTGLRPWQEARVRGLNLEPRALGLFATHGLLIAYLFAVHTRSIRWCVLAFLCGVGVLLSGSTSALLAAGVGTVGLLLSDRRSRTTTIRLGPALLIGGAVLLFILAPVLAVYRENVLKRVDRAADADQMAYVPENAFAAVAVRLDIFDASALAFLAVNPLYAVIGTGPGLISLPATGYVPPISVNQWVFDENVGVNSPPSHGLLLEIANGGIPGLLLWIAMVYFSIRAMRREIVNADALTRRRWQLALAGFATIAAIYLAQSPHSPVWAVFLALGVAADHPGNVQRSGNPGAPRDRNKRPRRRPSNKNDSSH